MTREIKTRELLYTLVDALDQQAEAFTCNEAEAVASLYRLHDMDQAAEYFINYHAEGDEPGDDHYRGES